jgi:hypothetical protein
LEQLRKRGFLAHLNRGRSGDEIKSGAAIGGRNNKRVSLPEVVALRLAGVLEAIELRHKIAVPERSRTRRPYFRCIDRLFWILLSRCIRSGVLA